MECGLVGDETTNGGGAVAVMGETQSVKPGGPSGAEVPLNADLVPVRRRMGDGRSISSLMVVSGSVA